MISLSAFAPSPPSIDEDYHDRESLMDVSRDIEEYEPEREEENE